MTVATLSRFILTRAGLVALGVLLCLVLLEIALRTAALFTAIEQPERIAQPRFAKQRVVCLGDSNTYGMFVKRDGAYPQVLERSWNGSEAGAIEVLNLGVPGTNSSKLRARFPHILAAFKPDVALVMIGANDFWTLPVPADPAEEAGRGVVYALWRASRAFRLLFTIWRSRQERERLEIEFEIGSLDRHRGVVHYGDQEIDLTFTGKAGPGATAGWHRDLERNLAALLAAARPAGTRVVFLTYPADFRRCYRGANDAIRAAAAATRATLVDLGLEFRRACADEPCAELLYKDCHPNPKGHELVAEKVRQALRGN
jgi:lysophospholipase L1-like esterase